MLLQEDLTGEYIAAAIAVHRVLGPGLLESAYEACLCRELHERKLNVVRRVVLLLSYKGTTGDCGYRLGMVVNELVIVELKCVADVTYLHKAQLLTYLRLSRRSVGLLLNFNVPLMKNGITRMVL